MTAIIGLDQKVTDHFADFMPDGVFVHPVDPSKLKNAREGALWVNELEVEAGWRSFGQSVRSHRTRSESIRVVLAGLVYRESYQQLDAAAAAVARLEEIVAAVETGIEADADLSLSGAVSWTLMHKIVIKKQPAESGWIAMTQIDLKCESRPSS